MQTHIFGMWDETAAPRENKCSHEENVRTKQAAPKVRLNLGLWCHEAAALPAEKQADVQVLIV